MKYSTRRVFKTIIAACVEVMKKNFPNKTNKLLIHRLIKYFKLVVIVLCLIKKLLIHFVDLLHNACFMQEELS